MTRKLFAACVAAMLVLAGGNAMADSIKGRVGVSGRIGFINPSNSDLNGFREDTDAGFIGGGGFIYGFTDNLAMELDITHAEFSSGENSFSLQGSNDFQTTNISLGGQYRFAIPSLKSLVPYAGTGLDILVNGIDRAGGGIDNLVGMHLSGGVDYFVLKQLAATGEMKGVFAPDADITDERGRKVGNYDPTNLTVTFGVRYFFN